MKGSVSESRLKSPTPIRGPERGDDRDGFALPAVHGGVAAGSWLTLGRRDYAATWALQRWLASARRDLGLLDLLLTVEHPPTITLGRGGSAKHLLASAADLAAMGARVIDVDRGGDITYHGPGQLVAYPIVDLYARGRDIHRYLRLLEEAIIRTLAGFGVAADRLNPLTGVWVGDRKIAAIGVKVSRGVTYHGLAINVDPDLEHFGTIVPCGIHDKGVTSVANLLGHAPTVAAVGDELARHLGTLLGVTWQSIDASGSPMAAITSHAIGAAQPVGRCSAGTSPG